jgi:tetratricopeptide (TPR) repeat protein
MFQSAKLKEKSGRWKEASELLTTILQYDPTDAHTHLALARLEAKRRCDDPNSARSAFERGTKCCPTSVHLWQAWARFEEQQYQLERARTLFRQALQIEAGNPYVCHSYGLMEQKLGLLNVAQELWYQGLETRPTAALVCSLAESMIAQKRFPEARDLYIQYGTQVETERERTEIYLASAWLEEKYFRNFEMAEEWIQLALTQDPSSSGRAQVALARLYGRRNRRENKSGKIATRKRLSEAVQSVENGETESTDGRVFNALAHVEVKSRNFEEARKILESGIERFPDDVSVRRFILHFPLLTSS